MKRYLINYIICLLLFFLLSCKKNLTGQPDDSSNKGFDININSNIYYQTELFSDKYMDLYNEWMIEGCSGGYSGMGYLYNFDRMVIEEIGIFKFYRNDTLLTYGKITIIEQNDSLLFIDLQQDSIFYHMEFFDMEKYVDIENDHLNLNAPCCDRFNYHFIKGN